MITAEQARFSQNQNLVTRALGVEPTANTEMNEYDVLPGDIYPHCSDGLNDMMEDEEIVMTLSALSVNLPPCAAQLVQQVNDHGGRDNILVVLVRVQAAFPSAHKARGWRRRMQSWFG